MRPVFARLCSIIVKHRDQITLRCTVSRPARSVAPKTETKFPHLYYYRNLALIILRRSFTIYTYSGPLVSNLSQTLPLPALGSKEGSGRHGLNVLRLIQVIVTWLTLTHLAEMHAEPVFDIAFCCHTRQHLNLKWIWLGGWTDSVSI